MDIFFEQLVKIKNVKNTLSIIGIYFAGIALAVTFSAICIYFYLLPPIILAVVVAMVYFAHFGASFLRLEYEYILTNGEMDIDRISNKIRRKRVATFEIREIESIKKYTKGSHIPHGMDKKIFAGNIEENTYSIVVKTKKGERIFLVITPNDRMLDAIKKYLPRPMKLEVFGEL